LLQGSELICVVQVFFAHFAMAMAASRDIKGIASHPNALVAGAQSIAFHALTILVHDVKELITSNVMPSIKRSLRSLDEVEQVHGEKRKAGLTAWLKASHPLAWSPAGGPQNATYRKLVTILNKDVNGTPRALNEAQDQLDYEQVATRLYNMGRKDKPIPVAAPVHKNGAFVHALPVAIDKICRRANQTDNAAQFTIRIFETMLRKMEIQFLPWHSPGPRAYAVQHDIWLIIKRTPTLQAKKTCQDNSNSDEDATQAVASNAADSNPSAPWKLPKELYQMGKLWNKKVLPSDWKLELASLDASDKVARGQYIRAVYEYVEKHYDGNIFWHHMAFVWAFLWSRVTPFVFVEKSGPINGRNSAELTAAVRRLRWIEGSSRTHKGVTDPAPYIVMVTTTLIALVDKKSPLSEYMSENDNSFGKPWTAKHGMLNFVSKTFLLKDFMID
jgi:hypothetical protein